MVEALLRFCPRKCSPWGAEGVGKSWALAGLGIGALPGDCWLRGDITHRGRKELPLPQPYPSPQDTPWLMFKGRLAFNLKY